MKYIVFLILLYVVGLFDFLKADQLLLIMHYCMLALCFGSLCYQLFYKGVSKHVFVIILFTLVFPIYASIQSNLIFGQSFFIGLLSMRYLILFNFGLFLNIIDYDYRLLIKQINSLNIFIAIVSIIALFVFGINSTNIYMYISNNNVIEKGESAEDLVKGIKLTICSGFMTISYVYYLLRIMGKKYNRKDILVFCLLMFYLLFVHKGRQPLALVCSVYAVYYIRMKGITAKRVFLGALPLLGVILLVTKDSSVLDGFSAVLDGSNTSDYSTLARLNSIESVIPYIKEHYMLGVGNLSMHFNDGGFQSIFGNQFFIADIGLIGTITRGGVALLFIYFLLYRNIYLKTKIICDPEIRAFYNYMIFGYILYLIIFSNDVLFSGGLAFTSVLYPLLTSKNPNLFILNLKR